MLFLLSFGALAVVITVACEEKNRRNRDAKKRVKMLRRTYGKFLND